MVEKAKEAPNKKPETVDKEAFIARKLKVLNQKTDLRFQTQASRVQLTNRK